MHCPDWTVHIRHVIKGYCLRVAPRKEIHARDTPEAEQTGSAGRRNATPGAVIGRIYILPVVSLPWDKTDDPWLSA